MTEQVERLIERLRKTESSIEWGSRPGDLLKSGHRNPDGPEAAALIESLSSQLAEARGALEAILHCTPHIVDEFGYASAAHKIEYDCGDPFEIARAALTAEQGEE